MRKSNLSALVTSIFCLLFVSCSSAESIATYPPGWESWQEVKQVMIYPAASELPQDASLFTQEVFRSFNWLNNGEGSSVSIRVHPNKREQYLGGGPFSDGATMVAFAQDAEIIFVIEHIAGQAIYGSYDTAGQDISHRHPELKPESCHRCHTSYREHCSHGVCSMTSGHGK
ncbi:hypothetical protein [Vibrio rhodolitus]|uniref:hypothetical protein n=1 Tax=Vibrio rhodolitus TaxID=2231649 RepID=UPI001FCA3BA7|nr:hypothetical protein [Vibrio rhodolitus]